MTSIYLFSYFPFGFECRICDLIVSVPDHCLSFNFTLEDILHPPKRHQSQNRRIQVLTMASC